MFPSPCQEDSKFKEIQIFMCLACRGASSSYVIKAEPTADYVNAVQKMMDVQRDLTGISRSVPSDIARGKYVN
jgi:hypothetical protein